MADTRLAATVVAGAALESQLRGLAAKLGIPTTKTGKAKTSPKMASDLNAELHAKANEFTTTEFQQVQAWIALRNDAAHAKPEFRTRTVVDVGAMITGIREMMIRHPA